MNELIAILAGWVIGLITICFGVYNRSRATCFTGLFIGIVIFLASIGSYFNLE